MRVLPSTISESEFLEGIKKVKRPKLKLAFYLGFYQCMRVSEIVNLKPENINMNTGFIHIKQAKGNKDRDIPIMPPVKHGLRHLASFLCLLRRACLGGSTEFFLGPILG